MTGLHHPGRNTRLIAATFAAAISAAACTKPVAKKDPAPVSVVAVVTRRMSVPYTVEANGIVSPAQTSNVVSQVDGIIMSVPFAEGQEVTKGQVLFKIDPRPYENASAQAQAALARDKASLDNAKRQADRYTQLAKDGAVTHEEADQQVATYVALQATVQGDEANAATAKFNLDNTTVRAPIAGRTGAVLVRTGNVVHAAGSTPLVVINQVRPIFVRFAVPAATLPMVLKYGAKGGLPVTAIPGGAAPAGDSTPPVQTSTPDATPVAVTNRNAAQRKGANGAVDGKLSFIDNAVDTTTGTIVLKASFNNESGSLWAGQFVAASLRLFVADSSLVVPSQAVVTGQKGTYVYVIDSANTATQQKVSVDRNVNGFAVITSGLNDGDHVVTEGQSRLVSGAKVTLRSANDTSSAAAGKGRGGRGGGSGRGGRAGKGKSTP